MEKTMKKKIFKVLISLASLFIVVLNVNAEDILPVVEPSTEQTTEAVSAEPAAATESTEEPLKNGSKWAAKEPVLKTLSSGIIAKGTIGDCGDWGDECKVFFTLTIPEDYEADTIDLSPSLLDELIVEPGDTIPIFITIVNKSKYTYDYQEGSFEVFPDNQLSFKKLENNNSLFNDNNVTDLNIYGRMYNTALQALVPNSDNSKVTDEVIGKALIAKGYSGISDYTKYLLDFYNTKYGTKHTRLDDFSAGIIREILGENDPLYVYNEAYKPIVNDSSNKLKRFDFFSSSSHDKVVTNLNAAVKKLNYSSVNAYVLDFYNKKYGTNCKSIDEFNREEQTAFYEYSPSFSAPKIKNGEFVNPETNTDMITLHYNYLYNKLVSVGFDNDEVTDDNSEDYSVGEYMRDETKGDTNIQKSAGTLENNSSNKINMTLYINGKYKENAYQHYQYIMHMQLSYTAKKGNVIATYVDQYGKTLADPVTTTGMVGKDYQTNAKEINGYELNKIEGDEKGKYIDGTIHVVYVYEYVLGQGDGEEPKIVPVSNKIPYTGVTEKNNNVIDSSICVSSLGLITILLLKRKELTK
jgi:hypothetical protein